MNDQCGFYLYKLTSNKKNLIKHMKDTKTLILVLDNLYYLFVFFQFCDDMRLMFENAWLYNRKTTKIYKWCSKVYWVYFLFLHFFFIKLYKIRTLIEIKF